MRDGACSRESNLREERRMEERKERERGGVEGGRLSLLDCGPRVRMERLQPGRATTLLMCRLPPNLAPLVDQDGRGNSDDGT
jgi:hypothetical protein